MKRIYTHGFALALVLALVQMSALAQGLKDNYVEPRLEINGALGVGGQKQFNWSQDPNNTTPWGRPIDSQYFQVPLVKAYDELGANPLLNGTGSYPSLQGKFALIMRGGGISFSQKAYYCQQAGAIGVIIVNHKNGGTIGMAPTTPFSTNTTIPVLIISREDGFPIDNALKAGQSVTVNLSSWGYGFANDLGFVAHSSAVPHAFCIPLSQVNTSGSLPRAYNFYNGSFVANFGTATQTGVKVKQSLSFQPAGGNSSVLYVDSVIDASFPVGDSLHQLFSGNAHRQRFSTIGKALLNYTLSSSQMDENPADNSVTYAVNITDSIFCKGRWDEERQAPLVSASYRYAATRPLVWGPLFYVKKGGYGVVKAQLAIGSDSDLFALNPISPSVLVYLYKWKDNSSDGLINGEELSIVALGLKNTFAANDSSNKPFAVDLHDPVKGGVMPKLEDDTWYFLAAELEHNFSLGADNGTSFYTRNYLSIHADSNANSRGEYWAPNFSANVKSPYTVSDDTLSNIPFTSKSVTAANEVQYTSITGLVPAMALHITKDIAAAVGKGSPSPINWVRLSPNPASERFSVEIALKHESDIVVSVVNGLGQSMQFIPKHRFMEGTISINTSTMASGTYYVVVATEEGSQAVKFSVAR
jgi:hypothetical protein